MSNYDLGLHKEYSESDYPFHIPTTEEISDVAIKKYLGKSPKYWEDLYSFYNIPKDKKEIREFISIKTSKFQSFLLKLPFLIHSNFLNLGLTLKLANDFDDSKILKIYIKTNLSAEESFEKLENIEDIIYSSNNQELYNSLMLSVEF